MEYCGALRAFFSPYFLRSLTRGSRVRKPAFFSAGRSSGSSAMSARAMREAQRTGLAGDAAAGQRGDDVVLAVLLQGHERLADELLVHLVREVVLEGAAVELELAGSGHEADADDRFLAAADDGRGGRE